MATLTNRRITATLLKHALASLNGTVAPLHALADTWVVNEIDDNLPAEAEVKAVLDGYKVLSVPALDVRAAVRDVDASTEEFTGVFAVPTTSFLWGFPFSGPVWAGLSQAQGFGVPLSIQRVTVFVEDAGSIGAALSLDVKIDGTSIFSTLPEIAAGSGTLVNLIVPESNFVTKSIPAASVLSAHIVTAPDDAVSITVNVWLKP